MSADLFSISSSLKPPPSPPQQLPNPNPNPPPKKRRISGNPDPDVDVIALSPKTLTATNRFFCEICNKGFQREQNLQLHRRGHNLPWKLKQTANKEAVKRKVYVCPETTCAHHQPSRALSDLTGIKKHFSRKHGEKKWKCEKCCKKYAVQSDWKAHSKTCGTREYKCHCGTLFSRKDSFITHRSFCDALIEESATIASAGTFNLRTNQSLLNQRRDSSHGLLAAGISQIATSFQLNPNRHGFPAAGAGLYPEMMQMSDSPINNLFGSSSTVQIGSTENGQTTFLGDAAVILGNNFAPFQTEPKSPKAEDNGERQQSCFLQSQSVYVNDENSVIDFLGMGGGPAFLSSEEMAKFASSMRSSPAMEMIQPFQ